MTQTKVFIINLDRSPERLQSIQQQLVSCRYDIEKISAVDGKFLPDLEHIEHYSVNNNKKQYFRPLTKGEIGCYLSHRAAWQAIVDQQLDFAVIVEDDVVIDSDVNLVIEQLSNINIEWDYIKLAPYRNRQSKPVFKRNYQGTELAFFHKAMPGTAAQAVSYKGAEKLLAASTAFGRPVDTDLQHCWEKDVIILNLSPFPFKDNCEFESDISAISSRKSLTLSSKFKKQQIQIKKYFNNKKYITATIAKLSK
ncbi:glycosyltransferase family 25 protein [Shewanella marina]|uniref:glycosyltransferase family 25 protein n=1 Tax=Shewanella marina TaxID=487319 RepID=UPI0004720720|nr:glycosyltransferase family 25 protein [Shewanella marina]